MYGIIGEGQSDVAMLQVLIRRLAKDDSLNIRPRHFGGCGKLLKEGRAQLVAFQNTGCKQFVVCHDADGVSPEHIRQKILNQIVRPAGLTQKTCILVPVQAIEAWILADIRAVTKVLSSWRPKPLTHDPESISDPKAQLYGLSYNNKRRPVYVHNVHNHKIA